MRISQNLQQKKYSNLRTSQKFTLVELLIVLAILAGLLTATVVSVENLQTKHYADKNQTIGDQIIEALERNDGLSFVSDMGRLPGRDIIGMDAAKAKNELKYLFADNDGAGSNAVLYNELDFYLPNIAPVNADGDIHSQFDSSLFPAKATEKFSTGWRGTYCERQEEIKDGWGNDWDVIFEKDFLTDPPNSEKFQGVKSLGRKHDDDSIVTPEGWQEEDVPFKIQNNLLKTELNIQLFNVAGMARTFDKLRVIYYSPRATDNFISVPIRYTLFYSNDSGATWETSVTDEPHIVIGFDGATLSNLRVGKKKLYVYAEGDDGGGGTACYASNIITLNLKPGTNNLKVILQEL
jgi:hypothetical protein